MHPTEGDRFTASGNSRIPPDAQLNAERLVINGTYIDHIKEVGPVLVSYRDENRPLWVKDYRKQHFVDCLDYLIQMTDTFMAWENKIAKIYSSKPYPGPDNTNESYLDAYRRTLTLDLAPHGETERSKKEFANWRSNLQSLRERIPEDDDIRKAAIALEDTWNNKGVVSMLLQLRNEYARKLWFMKKEIYNAFIAVVVTQTDMWSPHLITNNVFAVDLANLHGRRLARTKDDRLALVPDGTRKGDKVALLAGGSMPFIIHNDKVPGSSAPRWKLVGSAYVHGVMYGEKWDEDDCYEMEFI